MKNKKRVIQISLDIVVSRECNGVELADRIAIELGRQEYDVIGTSFQADMTEYYKKCYPNLFKA